MRRNQSRTRVFFSSAIQTEIKKNEIHRLTAGMHLRLLLRNQPLPFSRGARSALNEIFVLLARR
jgi:hypothetical protein